MCLRARIPSSVPAGRAGREGRPAAAAGGFVSMQRNTHTPLRRIAKFVAPINTTVSTVRGGLGYKF